MFSGSVIFLDGVMLPYSCIREWKVVGSSAENEHSDFFVSIPDSSSSQ